MAEQEVTGEEAFREEVLDWARGPRKMADWVRTKIPLEIDVGKYIFGQAISMIIGDDRGNCFSQVHLEDSATDQIKLNLDRACLVERLDWESSLDEVPDDDLKNQLRIFKQKVETKPWNNVRTERRFYESWTKNVEEFVRKKLKDDPSYSKARAYYDDFRIDIHTLYSQAQK